MSDSGLSVHKLAAAKRQKKTPRRPAGPAVVTEVDKDALLAALAIAGGDASRLRIIDGTTIEVRNRGAGERHA